MATESEQNIEIHQIAQEAAKATVKEFFLALGVNAEDPDAVIAMQKDMAHLRTWREASETVKSMSLRTAVGVIVSGALGMLYVYFGHGGR